MKATWQAVEVSTAKAHNLDLNTQMQSYLLQQAVAPAVAALLQRHQPQPGPDQQRRRAHRDARAPLSGREGDGGEGAAAKLDDRDLVVGLGLSGVGCVLRLGLGSRFGFGGGIGCGGFDP